VAYFRQILAVFVDVLLVFDWFILQLLLQVNAFVAGVRQMVNGIYHQVNLVEITKLPPCRRAPRSLAPHASCQCARIGTIHRSAAV